MALIMNNHLTLTEIYPTLEDFVKDYNNNGLPPILKNADSINTIYYLLQAAYGTWQIASNSSKVFAQKLFSTIWQYGPVWERKVELQTKIRNLSDDELAQGTKSIYNKALNPGSEPSTGSLLELNAILEQNTANVKRGKVEGLQLGWLLLDADLTKEFLDHFKPLFSKWNLDSNAIYVDFNEEEDEDE